MTTRVGWRRDRSGDSEDALISREWLVTNGIGGYASGTIAGVATRRYHGLLIAALPNPLGRSMMFNHLSEQVRLPDGTVHRFGSAEQGGALEMGAARHLIEFKLELGLPVWTFAVGGLVLEKRLLMTYLQNSVYIIYRLLEGKGPVRLSLRPAVQFRPHDAPVSRDLGGPYPLTLQGDRFELRAPTEPFPPLRMRVWGQDARFVFQHDRQSSVTYRLEAARGYEARGNLWSHGYFKMQLAPETPATLLASTESWETIVALEPLQALRYERDRRERLLRLADLRPGDETAAELVLAADQFLIAPAGRIDDATRARAQGEELRTVIAGYHWFTDWGRDTMISLEGLALCTGRAQEARFILNSFSHYLRDGLIPNLFPEGAQQGLYHTADATLWFFHALDRYLAHTGDRVTLQQILPRLEQIVAAHRQGTRFGIRVDPTDGLLSQGQESLALTWMDAKCDGWVVTPRRGKAVEINALWYNALRLMERWLAEERGPAAAAEYQADAQRVKTSFNQRFWYAEGSYLYDVVDGEGGAPDPAFRPNQILAVSLPHPGARSRALAWGGRRRPGTFADPGRPALAGPRASRLQADLPRRSPHPRCRLSPGHRLELAHRSLHRCLARGPSRRPRPGGPAAPGPRVAPGRGLRRLDQRGVRRRGPLHAARLRRSGLGSRRDAAHLATDPHRAARRGDACNEPVTLVPAW